MTRELPLEDVAGLEEDVDHFALNLKLALAQFVEQRFQYMGQLGHVGKTESAGAALDGMGGAEDRIQVFGVG